MELAKRQDGENGEFLLIKRMSKDKGRYLPLCYQMIESDWLTGESAKAAGRNTIDQGVEFDPVTGEIAAYHIADPDGYSTVRILAGDIIHSFQTLRPGQLRGISPFTTGVLIASDIGNIIDSTLDTAHMASKYLALITTGDVEGRQNGVDDSGSESDGEDEKIEELENAIIEYLRPGEDIKFPNNSGPGVEFSPFVKFNLRMLGVATGVPYDILSMDTSDLNYSKGKMVRTDFAHALKPMQMRHIRGFCNPTIKPFYDTLALSGRVSMPGYFTNPAVWQKAGWQPPGMESIDPAKETKGRIDGIKNGLTSEIEDARKRGRDYEEIIKEKAEAERIRKSYGVVIEDETSTAIQSNPAALEKQK